MTGTQRRRQASASWSAFAANKADRAPAAPVILTPEQAAAQRQAQRDARVNTAVRTSFTGRRYL